MQEKTMTLNLTKSEVTFIHWLLDDKFNYCLNDKNYDDTPTDAFARYQFLRTIINIERQIWTSQGKDSSDDVIESFEKCFDEWVEGHEDKLEEYTYHA